MKVKDLIALLQTMPQDAECYYGEFTNFLTADMKDCRGNITEYQRHDVYDIGCELKTVYQWSIRQQQYIPYTGVIFETD